MLAACAGKPLTPIGAEKKVTPERVTDKGEAARKPEIKLREVVIGDTLYSVAFDSGVDHRELAKWNGIEPPYLIKPGQKIQLVPPEKGAEIKKTRTPKFHTVQKGETVYRIGLQYDVTAADIAAWNRLPANFAVRVGQRLRVSAPEEKIAVAKDDARPAKEMKPTPTTEKKENIPSKGKEQDKGKPKEATPTKFSTAGAPAWSWPVEGTLIDRFGGNNKGVDIGARKGEPVRAAADGQVVYQGSGLRGYGQLIIVKHSTDFLSAYAHCDKIYVKEGDVVKRGQKVADMGMTGTDRVKLHFEIRHRGNPIDPLRHLPKK
jgi:lipoprotein NlpD